MKLQSVDKIQELLSSFLGPQLNEIVTAYADIDRQHMYYVEIPESDVVDLGIENLASLVARSSNVYGRAARFAGIARAQYKMLEGAYKKVYKSNKVGRNEDEREANAMSAAEDEYSALVVCEAVVHLAESIETAARIASESSRKLMDKVQSMQIASYREEKGSYLDSDFNTY